MRQGNAASQLPDELVWINGGTDDGALSKGENCEEPHGIGSCWEPWSPVSWKDVSHTGSRSHEVITFLFPIIFLSLC